MKRNWEEKRTDKKEKGDKTRKKGGTKQAIERRNVAGWETRSEWEIKKNEGKNKKWMKNTN